MMTSSNGNIFRVTDSLWGERTCHWTKASDAEVDDFFYLRLNRRLKKQSKAGDLRRHRDHYVATVMVYRRERSNMGSE